jgi:predicted kinase
MVTIHLIHGFKGFGRIMLVERLERDLPVVWFTHDELMQKLHFRNLPDSEYRITYDIVNDLLWELTEFVVSVGTAIALTYGLWLEESRKNVFDNVTKIIRNIMFHNIHCDVETAKKRVLDRTNTDDGSLFIDVDCFNKFLEQYEPIHKNEGYEIINH